MTTNEEKATEFSSLQQTFLSLKCKFEFSRQNWPRLYITLFENYSKCRI